MIVGAHIADVELFELCYELPVDTVAFERDLKIGDIAAQVHEEERQQGHACEQARPVP